MSKWNYNDKKLDPLKKIINEELASKSREEVKEIYDTDRKRFNGNFYGLCYTEFQKLITEVRIKVIEKEDYITQTASG